MSKLVVIACRLPHGLIIEVGQFGSPEYKSIKINGVHSLDATGKPSSIVHNGHAFTQVPEDVWNQWRKEHAGALYLKNRLVYAEDTLDAAHQATTLAEAAGKTGFEGLNPSMPPEGVEVNKEAMKGSLATSVGLR